MALLWPPAPLKLPPVHGAVHPTISVEQVARVAGYGAAFAIMARTICGPPSLRSPGGGGTASWKCQSTRRPRSIGLMAQNHQTKAPAFAGLRAVHSPTAIPLLGSKSKFPNRSSRGQKNALLLTRATLNSFTGEILNIFALAREETQHLVLKIGSNQILWSHISQCICILLLDLILNEAFQLIDGSRVGRGSSQTSLKTRSSETSTETKGKMSTPTLDEYGSNLTKLAKEVISVDMGRFLAGTKYHGEFEERLKNLLEEIKKCGNIILFLDEVHTLVGAGAAVEGAIDAANILKPALARGELQCIGATKTDEYMKHIEKDPALERCFRQVKVPEPTVDEALSAAAELSHKYISDRFLPDKAIDLIDEAGSLVRLRHAQRKLSNEVKDLETEIKKIMEEKNDAIRSQNFKRAKELHDRELELQSQLISLIGKSKGMTNNEMNSGMSVVPVVTKEDIRHIVSLWTGVPVHDVSTDETNKLLTMEQALHRRVIGQDEAVTAISRAIRCARVGLNDPRRPIASFVFAGPTGVGKSELAKALAAYYYGSEEAMVRLDMSELMERHAVSKLIGSPPGYVGHGEGGQLAEAVRRRPYSLVLFDEVEKAHPDVMNIMLQILDDDRLTDSMGRTVDFTNTLIIMTSNIGGGMIAANGGGGDGSKSKELVEEEMKRHFRPEFLNRLDETIVFRPLTKVEVREIAAVMVEDVAARVREVGVEMQVTEAFVDLVAEEGFDPIYGARLLEDTLADKMLDGEIAEGDSVTVDADAAGNVVVLGRNSRVLQLLQPVTFEI
ncbi:chaperone protein ClpC4, chloroplastic-like [Panicum miliaceum]|uniref:Chaperone protein ClpC4, chloroplastic-like n=1 Tax=Panicum miliaceum TaxID=4540 RepID=A0A3L6PR39_PANMI|nr:chaperone protein ClpC4, chloroplastic-like [Panicum miliaceum]